MTPEEWIRPAGLEAARAAQREIAARAEVQDRLPPAPALVAGVDCAGAARGGPDRVRAMAVLLGIAAPSQPRATSLAEGVPRFPYIPGFLGFREIPFVLEAVAKLPERPELILVDGHGTSHPRGCGIATHLGVVLDLPTVGVAKSILVGRVAGELGMEAGSTAPLVWKGRRIGTALRSRRGVQPLFISTGHRVSLETAVARVTEWLAGYRLPEPTRLADKLAGQARRAIERQASLLPE
ncbi:endonuclease V [Roseomonas sp. SSH11]|uniref:Endonuclease V n=2 Tax=Pararoseomonas baculiformis TaxID=2820812 RepID=A0ABS4AEV8_9PROT|nr:endonuclease V [Pararoseomonas baculiformis]MBP0445566.1 endonuclease V [Pararoseomonas baculiformis]